MNDYREVRLDLTPCSEVATDVAAAMLAEAGYESFVPDETGLTAYVPAGTYDANALRAIVESFPIEGVKIKFTDTFVEGRDWNHEWEQHYFKPIVIDDRCVIHSSFHTDVPHCHYDIVIDPKMAFGTGHHATTSLVIRRLLDMNLEDRAVMDMGTGTGILAILAAMRGAARVDAIEIDEFAHANAVDNVAVNHHPEIKVMLGDASLLPAEPTYDLLIANINRNIITADLGRYAMALKPGGIMLLSGFYVDDIEIVEAEAAKHSLARLDFTEIDRWACLKLKKNV